MERRHVIATVIAVAFNICAAAYGFGGLILAKFELPPVRGAGPVVAVAPGPAH